jgi:hypothetical protein
LVLPPNLGNLTIKISAPNSPKVLVRFSV